MFSGCMVGDVGKDDVKVLRMLPMSVVVIGCGEDWSTIEKNFGMGELLCGSEGEFIRMVRWFFFRFLDKKHSKPSLPVYIYIFTAFSSFGNQIC